MIFFRKLVAILFFSLVSLSAHGQASFDQAKVIEEAKRSFDLWKKGQSDQANAILEKLLLNRNMKLVDLDVEGLTLHGGFLSWREFIYILEARINYEKRDYRKALKFYSGISQSSPFYSWKKIESALCYIELGQLELAKSELENSPVKVTKDLHSLTLAYFHLKSNEIEKSIRLLQNAPDFQVPDLQRFKIEILTQAQFELYNSTFKKRSFTENQTHLETIIEKAKSLPVEFHSPKYSFLLSEILWHKASLLRTNDPIKYEIETQSLLVQAHNHLKPWFDKSVKQKSPVLSEEALFFSAVLLWEQQNFEAAADRLSALPELFPQGIYLPDTYQLLGDYYFDLKKYAQSVDYYRKLSKVGDEEKSAYAIFKAGWAFNNQKKKWEALRHFQRLSLFYRTKYKDEKSLPLGHLKKETDRDMYLMLAELLTFEKSLVELGLFQYQSEELISAQVEMAQAKTSKLISLVKEPSDCNICRWSTGQTGRHHQNLLSKTGIAVSDQQEGSSRV